MQLSNRLEGRENITIVIPVRNEEGCIVQSLQLLQSKVTVPYFVIVVDGCSTDKTVALTRAYIKQNKNVSIILTTPETSGFKDSIDIGIAHTTTSHVVVMMGDLCDDPVTINEMYSKVREGADVIIGSRYMRGGLKVGEPKIQGLISRTVNKTLYFLTGIPTHDASNPFKMYRKALLNSIKTESKGNEVPIEVIFKAYFDGAKIVEVPTVWRGRKSGKSKFKMLKVAPGYARLYVWALINSWRFQLAKLISPSF